MTMETCANCNRSIGNLETPYVHDGHVVCVECKSKLRPVVIDESDLVKDQSDSISWARPVTPRPAAYRPPPSSSPWGALKWLGLGMLAVGTFTFWPLAIIGLVLWLVAGVVSMSEKR